MTFPVCRSFSNIVLTLLLAGSCGSTVTSNGGGGSGGSGGQKDGPDFFYVTDGGGGGTGGGVGSSGRDGGAYSGGVTRPCVGLECQQASCVLGDCKQQACPGGAATTVSGVVSDPAGKVPLYNVIVYVPNAALAPITTGATCDTCESPVSGSPIAATLTDAKGEFRLDNVPVGGNIPLVIQIGKWRRQITVPNVAACANTEVADRNLTRMPRNQSEGHIPKIAVTTGFADSLECLFRKIGIQDTEFTPESGTGRINLFVGKRNPAQNGASQDGTDKYMPGLNGGAAFSPATVLWNDVNALKKYDIVVLSCEGSQNTPTKNAGALQALAGYANVGGRVFASHWHNVWLERGPQPFPRVAAFTQVDGVLPNPFTATVDTSFPKGVAFADWLAHVGASPMRGQIVIKEGKHTVDDVNPMMSRRWIYSTDPKFRSVQYFSFNTPIATKPECGRVVFTDIHVSAADTSNPSVPFPSGCKPDELTPQEKALEFMLFDLSSCVQPDDKPPAPPLIP